MQKIKVLKNIDFDNVVVDINSGDTQNEQQLTLVNNYYVYSKNIGGNVVNGNNVRDFLDKSENSELAKLFVEHLHENTTTAEFREIFYDNKKLSSTFNEYYKNNFLSNLIENNSIERSLRHTSGSTSQNNNFNTSSNRIGGLENILNQVPTTGNSYYVNVKIDKKIGFAPKGDYYDYFKNCTKGFYEDSECYYINNVQSSSFYVNIPYLLTHKNNQKYDFGYSPIEDINLNNLFTPSPPGQGRDGWNFNFFDFNQFARYFNYSPAELTFSEPGIFISQSLLQISNTNEFANQNYYQNNLTFEASFNTSPMERFDIDTNSIIRIPIKTHLSSPSNGTTKLFIQSEQYSTAILGNDFFMDSNSGSTNNVIVEFQNGQSDNISYIYVLNNISPEDTIVLSLRNQDSDDKVLGFLIVRCEEFVDFSRYYDNSYLLIENKQRENLFLHCFVDYNYDDNDMEFYRNKNLTIIDNRTTTSNSNGRIRNQQNSISGFDINDIIRASKLQKSVIRNIYLIGSRIYKTNSLESDYDVSIIADIQGEDYVITEYPYQIKIISVKKFNQDLAKNTWPTIEWLFLPEWAKIQEDIKVFPKIEKEKLIKSTEDYINLNLKTIEYCYKKPGDNMYKINKLNFYIFRALIFAKEILKTGKISDFTIANPYYDIVNQHNFMNYKEYFNYIKPKIESLEIELQNVKITA